MVIVGCDGIIDTVRFEGMNRIGKADFKLDLEKYLIV
jgi:hypothetical protein